MNAGKIFAKEMEASKLVKQYISKMKYNKGERVLELHPIGFTRLHDPIKLLNTKSHGLLKKHACFFFSSQKPSCMNY